jgi:hypothetical protein
MSELQPNVFLIEYLGYWSQAKDDRLSSAKTTAKVNCKLHSHYLYMLFSGIILFAFRIQ